MGQEMWWWIFKVSREWIYQSCQVKFDFWWTLCSMTKKKKLKRHFFEISCEYPLSPKREYESFWLMKHILPKWWTHPFWSICEHCWPKFNFFVHKISDIWIPIRFLVILMVTQDEPLIVVTPWLVLLPECPHVDVPRKINRHIIMEFTEEFQVPVELLIQSLCFICPVISFKALALSSLNQGHS